jgi:hypothetical protein
MEGAGVADATWTYQAGYLVVRGICDYCDANKGDVWQAYAALIAAAYTQALLESIPRLEPRSTIGPGQPAVPISGFPAIYYQIDIRSADPDVDRAELRETIQRIKREVAQGTQANPARLERRLLDLAEMAPDIFALTTNHLTKPATGLRPDLVQVLVEAQANR